MEVLRLAFPVIGGAGVLSPRFLSPWWRSISASRILGELNFGSYGTGVTLFAGFLVLILAPEFFQPSARSGHVSTTPRRKPWVPPKRWSPFSAPMQAQQMGNGTDVLEADCSQLELHCR
jgi:ATP-binding cassette, subfamily C, bacterial CydD